MAGKNERYTDIILPGGEQHTFDLCPFPPDALPISTERLPQWLASIDHILSQDHLPRSERWHAIKPYYYGGLSVLIDLQSKEVTKKIKYWKQGDILSQFPVSSATAKFDLSLTAFRHDCMKWSFDVAERLFPSKPPHQNLELPPLEQEIFQHVNFIHQALLETNHGLGFEPVAIRIHAGVGTALEHLFIVVNRAPSLWEQRYSHLPTTTELQTLLTTTYIHHLSPLSRTHIVALVGHEIANQIGQDRPQDAGLMVRESSQGPFIGFIETPARIAAFTLEEMESGRHTLSSPRLGCPARLKLEKLSPIRRLFDVVIPQVVGIYADVFTGSSSSMQGT